MKGNPNFAARRSRQKYAPRRSRSSKGFARLVITLSAITFLGVYGLLTPETIATSAPSATSGFADTGWATASATQRRDPTASAYYRNCAAARAAGAAPLHIGEPGYRSALDRDGDGVACEPYYGR